jgi:hypothetical protein
MKNKITKRGLFAVSAKTIDERKPEVVALMKRYGMNVNENDSKDKIDMAFLSLLPRSRSFRQDFAQLATPVAEKIHSKYKNYVGDDFFNIFGLEKKNPMADVMNIPSKGIGTMPAPIGGGVAGGVRQRSATVAGPSGATCGGRRARCAARAHPGSLSAHLAASAAGHAIGRSGFVVRHIRRGP